MSKEIRAVVAGSLTSLETKTHDVAFAGRVAVLRNWSGTIRLTVSVQYVDALAGSVELWKYETEEDSNWKFVDVPPENQFPGGSFLRIEAEEIGEGSASY